MDEDRRANAASFGRAAPAYERGRPSYPRPAIDWLVPPSARRILDLGAGTGKLTRQLCARGLDVVAVEPSAEMRAQLESALPGMTGLAGSAEAIPLPDNSIDCVLVAQAWHWVQPELAIPEVIRVLRPGGRIGLLWNLRDEQVAWVAELGRILGTGHESAMTRSVGDLGSEFGPIEELVTRWEQELTPRDLLDLIASRSYVITASPESREALMDGVRDLLRDHPALAGHHTFQLPYLTHCFRADLAC